MPAGFFSDGLYNKVYNRFTANTTLPRHKNTYALKPSSKKKLQVFYNSQASCRWFDQIFPESILFKNYIVPCSANNHSKGNLWLFCINTWSQAFTSNTQIKNIEIFVSNNTHALPRHKYPYSACTQNEIIIIRLLNRT